MELDVYHIGLGSFGRYGFEKLLDLQKHFDEVDVKVKAVCDSDPERLEKAKKFAETQGVEIQTFEKVENMYYKAEKDRNVMVYDAGPTDRHAENIYLSMQYGFFHLSEKPPSVKREQHLKEKRLAERNNAMWKADFIERENPVVKKAVELVKDQQIDRIKIFRESSVGIEKMLNPVKRRGVKGGDILDKMVHEAYVLDLLESSSHKTDLKLIEADTSHFMPWRPGSEKLMSIEGGYEKEINYNTSTGQTHARFRSSGTEIELNSSWLGLSQKFMHENQKIREKTGVDFFKREYTTTGNSAYVDEEARMFIIEGERSLVGDMLHKKLYDLETGEEINLDYYLHDQLYRVLRDAVLRATGIQSNTPNSKDIDIFMNAIFDVKESVAQGEFLEELEKGLERFESMIIEDRKVLEAEDTELILS